MRPLGRSPKTPCSRKRPEPDDKVHVDAPEAARLLDFACASYGLLLRVLGQSFGRTGSKIESDQQALMALAFDLMHVLGSAATKLAAMPASSGDLPHAGMSFTMLRGVEPLLGSVEGALIKEQLLALSASDIAQDITSRLRHAATEFELSGGPD